MAAFVSLGGALGAPVDYGEWVCCAAGDTIREVALENGTEQDTTPQLFYIDKFKEEKPCLVRLYAYIFRRNIV